MRREHRLEHGKEATEAPHYITRWRDDPIGLRYYPAMSRLPEGKTRWALGRNGGSEQFRFMSLEILAHKAVVGTDQVWTGREGIIVVNSKVERQAQFLHQGGEVLFVAEAMVDVNAIRIAIFQELD